MIKEIDIDSDPYWTLKVWKEFIDKMISTYGEDAILFTDAGANNVQLTVRAEEKL